MQAAIQVQNLVHAFNGHTVLDGLNFEVNHGEVFGLLGPNGAGKTTSVRLLNGLYTPLSGSINVLGLDPTKAGKQVRQRSGVLTETPALYERLTARENLEFFGTLAGIETQDLKRRIAEQLAFFELEKRANDRVGAYSKGMKQRLALARALLTRPELLYFDEPTSGLDPESALQVRELIQSIRARDGHTVFLCTHHLDEAERLCDRVAVMKNGRFLASGSLAKLTQRYMPGCRVILRLALPPACPLDAGIAPGVLSLEGSFPEYRLQVESEAVIPGLITHLVETGAQILSVNPELPSLEDIYFTFGSLIFMVN